METWVVQVLTGIIAGGVAGLIAGLVLKSSDMGTLRNVLTGALGGVSLANIFLAYGFDDTNPWIWCLIWALAGGVISQVFFGRIRHGLHVFRLVVTGKEDQIRIRHI